MKYCCDMFSRLVENAGNRGIAVVHVVAYEERRFSLQFRPFDADVFECYSKLDSTTGKNSWPEYRNKEGDLRGMEIISNQSILFCPGCGKELRLIIEGNTKEFDHMVIQQRRLLA